MAKYGLLKVLSTDIKIAPMLTRELKIMHRREFNLEDKSDILHAISAFIEPTSVTTLYRDAYMILFYYKYN